MADSRINLLTSASSTANDDFFVIDGATNGTRKLNAFTPTIGGSLSVTGTLTAGSTLSTSAGLICQNADITGGYMVLRGYGSQDNGVVFLGQSSNNNYIQSNATTIGVTITGTGVLSTIAAGLRVLPTTASTNTSSGALVVGNGTSGGLGVGGDTFIGGSLTVTGALNGIICNGAGLSLNTAGSASVRFQDTGVSKWWIYKLSGDVNLYFRDMVNSRMQMVMVPGANSQTATTSLSSSLFVEATTASNAVNTGALVVSGGIGALGAINAGGAITSNNGSGSGLLGMRSSSGNASYVFWSETGVSDRGILGFNNGSSTLSYRSGASSFATGTEVFSVTSSGNTTVAGTLTVANTSAQLVLGVDSGSALTYTIRPSQAGGAIQIVQDSATVNRWLSLGGVNNSFVYTESLRITNGGHVAVTNSTASTASNIGALVVSGGVGVAGAVNVGGSMKLNYFSTAGDPTALGVVQLYATSNSTSGAGGIEWKADTGGNGYGYRTLTVFDGVSAYDLYTQVRTNSASWTNSLILKSNGNAIFAGAVQTNAPTGGTSAPWKLGTVATVTPTSPNRTIEVDINGVTYYLHAKTTNN